MQNISVILITYKSEEIIKNFIRKIPSVLPVIIIENSHNHKLKKEIESEFQNIKVYLRDNNGVSSSLNFAIDKVKTKYFLQISPDIEFDFKELHVFFDLAKKLNDRFAAIGPRFHNVVKKSHKQISKNIDYGAIDSIHGSCMFINKECYERIGGFDNNFFLYFEETDYCYRGKKLNYNSYQTNKSNVSTTGRSVNLRNILEKKKISNLLIWHFIWSKFYYYKKRYGKIFSIIIFTPTIIRIRFKILLNKLLNNKEQLEKYTIRNDGLMNSIKGNKSNLRP